MNKKYLFKIIVYVFSIATGLFYVFFENSSADTIESMRPYFTVSYWCLIVVSIALISICLPYIFKIISILLFDSTSNNQEEQNGNL